MYWRAGSVENWANKILYISLTNSTFSLTFFINLLYTYNRRINWSTNAQKVWWCRDHKVIKIISKTKFPDIFCNFISSSLTFPSHFGYSKLPWHFPDNFFSLTLSLDCTDPEECWIYLEDWKQMTIGFTVSWA